MRPPRCPSAGSWPLAAASTSRFEACLANDPERAEAALRDHLATKANHIAVALGGTPLYELSPV